MTLKHMVIKGLFCVFLQAFPLCCLNPESVAWIRWFLRRRNVSFSPSTPCLWWRCSQWPCPAGCTGSSLNPGASSASAGTSCLNLVGHIWYGFSSGLRFNDDFFKNDYLHNKKWNTTCYKIVRAVITVIDFCSCSKRSHWPAAENWSGETRPRREGGGALPHLLPVPDRHAH